MKIICSEDLSHTRWDNNLDSFDIESNINIAISVNISIIGSRDEQIDKLFRRPCDTKTIQRFETYSHREIFSHKEHTIIIERENEKRNIKSQCFR